MNVRYNMEYKERRGNMIEICHLTKDYGNHRGVFDMSFQIHKGEILGILGPNGSGKTTIIRHLMGFIKPDQGTVQIQGKDCFQEASFIQQNVGYLPGEIAFMDDMTGMNFIHLIAKLKGIHDLSYAHWLINFLELNAQGQIKRMSKGMKQKIGLVIALMHDPAILILDEPTSGLDPLMQMKFIELMKKAKQQGKTVFMSSHIFEEIENVCNRVVIIKEGQVVTIEDIEQLKHHRYKHYEIQFHSILEMEKFMHQHPDAKRHQQTVSLLVKGSPDQLIKELSSYTIDDFNVQPQSLEEIFLQYYGE